MEYSTTIILCYCLSNKRTFGVLLFRWTIFLAIKRLMFTRPSHRRERLAWSFQRSNHLAFLEPLQTLPIRWRWPRVNGSLKYYRMFRPSKLFLFKKLEGARKCKIFTITVYTFEVWSNWWPIVMQLYAALWFKSRKSRNHRISQLIQIMPKILFDRKHGREAKRPVIAQMDCACVYLQVPICSQAETESV